MAETASALPTIAAMEYRLQAWAAWVKGGRTSAGYPVKSVLHESWMPPAAGQVPSMRAAISADDGPARRVHAAIEVLSLRLQNTLVVVYVHRASVADQVALLDCQASTVRARVKDAKRLIAAMLQVLK